MASTWTAEQIQKFESALFRGYDIFKFDTVDYWKYVAAEVGDGKTAQDVNHRFYTHIPMYNIPRKTEIKEAEDKPDEHSETDVDEDRPMPSDSEDDKPKTSDAEGEEDKPKSSDPEGEEDKPKSSDTEEDKPKPSDSGK